VCVLTSGLVKFMLIFISVPVKFTLVIVLLIHLSFINKVHMGSYCNLPLLDFGYSYTMWSPSKI